MAIELAYINTKHPDFQREATMVSTLMHTHIEDSATQRMTAKHQKRHTITYPLTSNNGDSPVKEVSHKTISLYTLSVGPFLVFISV